MMGDHDGLMEHCTTNAERRQLRRARRQLAQLNTLLAQRSAVLLTFRLTAPWEQPRPDEAPITPEGSG